MSPEEEIARVVPVIEGIVRATIAAENHATDTDRRAEAEGRQVRRGGAAASAAGVTISVDTRRAVVAKAALAAGAHAVNDVSGGTFDPEMLRTVAEAGVPLIMMHMR